MSAHAEDAARPDEVVPAAPAEGVAEEAPRSPAEAVPSGAEDERAAAVRRLEEEGDVAADYVEELLDIADLDGDIDIEVRDGRTYVSVVPGEDDEDDRLADLVGSEGRTLEALQELVRLAVLASTGHRSRLILDIAGHRERREAELRAVAAEAVERVRTGEAVVHLDPMGAYERKIVHDVVADSGLASESEVEGPRRHVVISRDA